MKCDHCGKNFLADEFFVKICMWQQRPGSYARGMYEEYGHTNYHKGCFCEIAGEEFLPKERSSDTIKEPILSMRWDAVTQSWEEL